MRKIKFESIWAIALIQKKTKQKKTQTMQAFKGANCHSPINVTINKVVKMQDNSAYKQLFLFYCKDDSLFNELVEFLDKNKIESVTDIGLKCLKKAEVFHQENWDAFLRIFDIKNVVKEDEIVLTFNIEELRKHNKTHYSSEMYSLIEFILNHYSISTGYEDEYQSLKEELLKADNLLTTMFNSLVEYNKLGVFNTYLTVLPVHCLPNVRLTGEERNEVLKDPIFSSSFLKDQKNESFKRFYTLCQDHNKKKEQFNRHRNKIYDSSVKLHNSSQIVPYFSNLNSSKNKTVGGTTNDKSTELQK